MSELNRRSFLASTAAVSVPMFLPACAAQGRSGESKRSEAFRSGGPVAVSSANGIPAVNEAMVQMRAGREPVAAAVEGVTLVENDPDDMSVGYGGLPNEDGVVQLDASVMHGPLHKAGCVAALENIKNPARVALHVLRHTDHVLLVGDGALKFAKEMGFEEENLLTDKARRRWLRWKRNLNPQDDWLDDETPEEEDDGKAAAESAGLSFTHGTIHCSALDARGDLGAVTTTSGLSYKIPGRVGDSPIIGAGMFVDNAIGAAGSTGRGEAVIQSCGSFQIVQHMAAGVDPTEACLKVLRWIAAHTKRPMLLNKKGEPNFDVKFYALRKDGAYGGASMLRGKERRAKFAVHDGTEARLEDCAYLYD